MYSGQEVVEQEKCKIILASFYEGIVCYNQTKLLTEEEKVINEETGLPFSLTKQVIKLNLLDSETASYDPITQTLTTINFSARPFIIPEDTDFTYFFEAEIPEGTTGLVVTMHTESYEKERIMPLAYIELCNDLTWDWNYSQPGFEWLEAAYVKSFCINEDTTTQVVFQGEIDETSSELITLVGYLFTTPSTVSSQDVFVIEPLSFQLLDNGVVIDMQDYTLSTETILVDTYEYSVTGVLTIVPVEREQHTLTFAATSTDIAFSGLYNSTLSLFPCNYLTRVGTVWSWCYNPVSNMTEITYKGDSIEVIDDEWIAIVGEFYLGTVAETRFRVLDKGEPVPVNMNFEQPTDPMVINSLYIPGGDRLEFILPEPLIVELERCDSISSYMFAHMTWEQELEAFRVNLMITGQDVVTPFHGGVPNNVVKVGEYYYELYDGQDNALNILSGHLEVDDHSIQIDNIITNWCSTYMKIYYIETDQSLTWQSDQPIDNYGYPVHEDWRISYNFTLCKFEPTCALSGISKPCLQCTSNGDGSITVTSDRLETSEHDTCTATGLLSAYENVNACFIACANLSLGEYPMLAQWTYPYVDAQYQTGIASGIYLDANLGLSIVMNVDYMKTSRTVLVYDLNNYITPRAIYDSITGDNKTVRPGPFIWMYYFGVPYDMITSAGNIDGSFWGSEFDDGKLHPNGFITVVDLVGKIPGLANLSFDWLSNNSLGNQPCSWMHQEMERPLDFGTLTISVDNYKDLDKINYEDKVEVFTGVHPYTFSPSWSGYDLIDDDYLNYVKDVRFLTSPESTAYAIAKSIYPNDSYIGVHRSP